MKNLVQRAQQNVQSAEVQLLLKELAKHGLAVTVPHKHLKSGRSVELPAGYVQLEQNCKVTFVKESEVPAKAYPVSWRFDSTSNTTVPCSWCCDD